LPNDPTSETTSATADRGQRRRCSKCSAPFYDLRRDPIICPKCGAKQVPALPLRHERPRPTPTGREAEPVVVTAAEEAAEDDTDEKEEDDDTDAETPELDAEPDTEPDAALDDETEPPEPGKSGPA
jgi:uncharacterized protein (TIGR02300 family)